MSGKPEAIQCMRVACYNARNGRQCWMAQHPDGRFTFEYASEAEAREAAAKPYEQAARLHTISTC